MTSWTLTPMADRIPAPAAELDCIPDSQYSVYIFEQTKTHLLEAVAALNITSVARTGGRKDGEGEESSNGGNASEHGE